MFLENRGYWGKQGAGTLAIATDIGKWLVALRGPKTYEPNTWANIGGKIDDDEVGAIAPEHAAKREFFEEMDYTGPMKLYPAYVWVSPEKDETGNPKFIYHNFIGEIVKGTWEPKINWETSRVAWVDYEGLMEIEPKHYGLTALIKNSGGMIKALSQKYQH